jgi:hypothetical protein
LARDCGIEGFSQYSFRHFMADQVRRNFALIPREDRSRWLGHVVRDGSRTTDHCQGDDPQDVAAVALATCISALLAERCERDLFAIETLLNRVQLAAIGVRQMPERLEIHGRNGGCDRDRTLGSAP